MKQNLLVSLAAAWLSTGCMLFGGLHVEPVATSAQKPGNVAVYVSVRQGDHSTGALFEKNFHISEDGQELSLEQTKQALLPRDMVAVHRALLLLDLSGPIGVGETRQRIAEAAARFVSKAHVAEPVTVYGFDGGPALSLLGEFPQGTEDIAEIPGLSTYTQTDPSSNLHSAVIEAMSQLDARLMVTQKPVRIGTLVVFARGPDLAGRVPEGKMYDALSETKHHVYAIGVKDVPGFRPGRIGRAGTFEAESQDSLLRAFDEAGAQVAETVGRYYLLSYCTPARAGQRHVRIKVVGTDEAGKEISGSMSTEFDASGFTSGCDPTQRPRFVAQATPSPPSDEEKSKPAATEKPDAKAKTKTKSSSGARAGGSTAAPATKPAAEDEGDDVVPPPSKPGYAQ
jgi:hypothetical protein